MFNTHSLLVHKAVNHYADWLVNRDPHFMAYKMIPQKFLGGVSSSWWSKCSPLKNIRQNGNLPQIGVNIKNI